MHRVRFYDPQSSQSRGRKNITLPSPRSASKGSKVTNLTPDWSNQLSQHPSTSKPPNVYGASDKGDSSGQISKNVPALDTDNVEGSGLLSLIDPRLLDGKKKSEQPGCIQSPGVSSNPESRLEFCESNNYQSHTDHTTMASGISRNRTARLNQKDDREARRESPQPSGTFVGSSHTTIETKRSDDLTTRRREDHDRPTAEVYRCGSASSLRKDLSEPDQFLGIPSFMDHCQDNVDSVQLSFNPLPYEPVSCLPDVESPTSGEDNNYQANTDYQAELSGIEEGSELTRRLRRRHTIKAGKRDNLRHATTFPVRKGRNVPVQEDNRWKPYQKSPLSMLRNPTSPETALSEELSCNALVDDTDFTWSPEYPGYLDSVMNCDEKRIPMRGYLELSPGRLGTSVVLRGFLPPSEPSRRDERASTPMLRQSSYGNERFRACSVDIDYRRMRSRFTAEEDELIHILRNQGLSWKQMERYFPGRKASALQSRWSRQLQHEHRAINTKRGEAHQDDFSGR